MAAVGDAKTPTRYLLSPEDSQLPIRKHLKSTISGVLSITRSSFIVVAEPPRIVSAALAIGVLGVGVRNHDLTKLRTTRSAAVGLD